MNKQNIFNQRGLSIIELMIAIAIGLIVTGAIISLFDNFGNMNRTQNGLARLQENGRYATMRMKKDIENVGFQPCANISMDSPVRIDRGFATRPLFSFSDLTNGLPNNSDDPVLPHLIDTQYFIQGHECDGSGNCIPSIGVQPGGDPYGQIPDAGTTEGTRAFATDVLTVRYIASEAINVDDSAVESTDSTFNLASDPQGEPLNLEDGDDILIANCFNAMIVKASPNGESEVLVPEGGVNTFASVAWASKESMSSVYNFTKDFLTVTYYVGFKKHPVMDGKVISSLYRVENGNAPQELVEGVERFDLTYGVQFWDGRVGYLSASEINNASTTECIIPPLLPSQFVDEGVNLTNTTGCLWRSVFAIRVNLLLNTVYNSSVSATDTFIYTPDGMTPQSPADIPSSVDPGKMYRKEFTSTIPLQSYNL